MRVILADPSISLGFVVILDDITQPDEQLKNYSSNILNCESSSLSNEVDAKERLQLTQHTGGDRYSTADGNLCCSGSSVSKEQKIGK